MPKSDSPCALTRQLHERHAPYWSDFHEAMSNEEAFLNGDRYVRDAGAHNRDRRRVQIRGEETRSRIRHVVAKMCEKPRNIMAKPLNPTTNQVQAEMAVKRLEWELGNPWKGYDDEEYAALMSACEMRLGIVWMDYDVDDDEIYFGREDGRRFMWDPSWHPHHPKNAWLFREKRVHVDEARATYGVEWLEPDRGAFHGDGTFRNHIPILLGPDGRPVKSENYDDDKVTIWECWYKRDRSKKEKWLREEPLEPGARYMTCLSCGKDSPTQADAGVEFHEVSGPSLGSAGCDLCGGDMKRVDAKDVLEQEAKYKNGRRLLTMAPLSPGPNDDPIYEGGWPIPSARSYPGLFITRYAAPGKPMGGSDVVDTWDQQLAKDNLMTQGVASVFQHKTYWEMPSTGILSSKGKRFMFRDDERNMMFRDMSNRLLGNAPIIPHRAAGLDPNWSAVVAQVDASLTREAPKFDVGPAESNTRDIAVGTIERQVAEAEVTTEDFRRRRNRARSQFAGVVWDYIRATDTPEKSAQLDLDGMGAMGMPLTGDEYPNCDFVIEDMPDFTGLDKARSEAARWALGIVTNPVTEPYFDILAEIQQLPASTVKKIQERSEEIKAEAQAATMAGMPPEGDPLAGGGIDDLGGVELPGEEMDMAGMGAESDAL